MYLMIVDYFMTWRQSKLLREIKCADGIISNISGGGMTMFGFAYYWEAIPMNRLSFECMVDSGFDIQYIGVWKNNRKVICFKECNKQLLYGKMQNNNDNNHKNLLQTTIYDKMAKYSKIEVKELRK